MGIKRWELYFLSVIKNERRGLLPSLLRFFLLLLSGPYRFCVALRNWFFDHGWLRSYIPPVPLVISIGNITAGGTGKTPVTMMIAQALHGPAPLAILSRGYRSRAENSSVPLLLHKKKGQMHPASLCGDEPFLLAENLPHAYVIVGRDRYLSSKMAARMGAEVLLLDDGMQHRGIARDFEVVVMDLMDPFGQGYFLPRGLLREGCAALARADLIILNHTHQRERFDTIKRQISQTSSAPIIGTKMEVIGLFDLKDEVIDLPQRIAIFCGIAHPEYFRSALESMGIQIVNQLYFPDHDALDLEQLMRFSHASAACGAQLLICTEKDRVKIVDPGELHLPIGWVKSRLQVVEGHDHWTAFINQAKMSLPHTG